MGESEPRRTFEAREALAMTGATRSELVRWTNAGILAPYGGGGSQGKRRTFDLRNLVTLMVLVRAHSLKVNEAGMKQIADTIAACRAEDIRKQWEPAAIWFGIKPSWSRYATDPPQEPKAIILPISQTAEYLESGYCGTIISITDIVYQLERYVGELLQ